MDSGDSLSRIYCAGTDAVRNIENFFFVLSEKKSYLFLISLVMIEELLLVSMNLILQQKILFLMKIQLLQ